MEGAASINLVDIIIDEVALEGLDGITLEALWKRLGQRLNEPLPLAKTFMTQIWSFCASIKDFSFFELPEPRRSLVIYDRYEFIDPEIGMILEPEDLPPDIYPHSPIHDVENGIIGSCSTYYTRKDITESVRELSIEDAIEKYGEKLAIVASQKARDLALMGSDVSPTLELNTVRYCFLERVGRSRYHGEVTQGKLSLNALGEDPRSLFYHRKFLLRHKLITKQLHHQKSGGHSCNGSLLHLPRFFVERIPKLLYLAEQVIEILRAKPDYIADYDEIKKNLELESSIKKLFNAACFQKVVRTDIRLPYRAMYPNAEPAEWQHKNNPTKERTVRVVKLMQPDVDIKEAWNKDEAPDDDVPQEVDISEQKYGVSFLTQANMHVEAGKSEGVTQLGFAKTMGLTKLQSRTFLRNLVKANMVATYMDDIGRQRLTKFVSKKFEKSSEMSKQFKEEIHKIKEWTKHIATDTDVSCQSQSTNKTICMDVNIKDNSITGEKDRQTVKTDNEIAAISIKEDKSPDLKETEGPTVSREELAKKFNTVNRIVSKYSLNKCIVKYQCARMSLPVTLCKKEQLNVKHEESPDALLQVSEDQSAETFYKNIKEELMARKSAITGKPVNDMYGFMEDLNNSENMPISNITYRLLRRANMIIESVKKHQIIEDMTKLIKMIQEEEDKEGYDVKIDKKSLIRLLQRLAKDKLLKIIKLTLASGTRQKYLTFICDAGIDADHSVIQSAVEQAKLQFCLSGYHKMRLLAKRLKNAAASAPETETGNNDDRSKLAQKAVTLKQPLIGASSFQYDPKVARRYGYIPKFVRMQALHIFMYYLVYDHPGPSKISKREQIEILRADGYKITDELAAEFSTMYSKEIGWKMFVPPLPKHASWPHGWTLMCDIFLRMPLSIFMKVHFVTFVTTELDPYLNHPIRKHYLIKDLPYNMRNLLLYGRKYIFDVHQTVMKLCYIGLVQFGPQRLKEKDQVFIYVNRRTELMDTTSSSPGYHKIEDKPYPVTKYLFDNLQTVEKYWYDMWNTCINTSLGGRLVVQGKDIVLEDLSKKADMIKSVAARGPEEAVELDTGFVPGDRKGAAGLDSACFAHLKRNWSWGFIKNYKTIQQKKAAQSSKPQREAYLSKIKAKSVKLADSPGFRKVSESRAIATSRKRAQVPKKTTQKEAPAKKCELPERKPSRQKSYVRRVLPRKPKRRSRLKYDETDYGALQRMNKLRVDWDPTEDKILILCKIVMVYICPNPRKQLVTFTAVRDVLRKYSFISYNKTSRACQRRLLFMCRKQQTVNSIALGVEEIKQNFFISQRFGGIVEKLKQEYKDTYEFEKRVTEAFKSLVDYVAKKYYDISEIRPKEPFPVPKTIQEFNIYYKPVYPTKPFVNRGFAKDVRNVNDIHSATINSVIHSSMCCCKDRRSWAFQLFKVYQQYPEILLRNAMMKIRSDQMVTIKKNYMCTVKKYGNCIPISSSQYQLSTSYIYKFQAKWPYDIFNEAYGVFVKLIKWYRENRMNGSTSMIDRSNGIELTPVSGGLIAAINDYLMMGQMDFDIVIPNQIIMLDPRLKEKSETYFRIAQRYQDVLSNMDSFTFFRAFSLPNQKISSDETKRADGDQKDDIILSDDNSNNVNDRLGQNVKEEDALQSLVSKKGTKSKDTEDGKERSDCEDLNSDIDEAVDVIKFQDGTKIVLNIDDVDRSSVDEGSVLDAGESSLNREDQPKVKRLKLDTESGQTDHETTKRTCKDDSSRGAAKPGTSKRLRDDSDETTKSDTPLVKKAKLFERPKLLGNENSQRELSTILEEESNPTEASGCSETTESEAKDEDETGQEKTEDSNAKEAEGDKCSADSSSSKAGESIDVQKRYTRIALLKMKDELSDLAMSDSHHAHEYFVVNAFKLLYSIDLPDNQPSAGLVNFQDQDVPSELVPLSLDTAKELVRKINKCAVFPKDNISYSDFKKTLPKQLSRDLASMDAIYKFVRDKKEIGATIQELIDKFEDLGEDLRRLVNLLTKNYLFLRSGVTTVRYVHHRHVDPWLIHSYKIYRLEREAIAPLPKGTMYSADSGTLVNAETALGAEPEEETLDDERSIRGAALPKTLFDLPASGQQPLMSEGVVAEGLEKDVSSDSEEEHASQTKKRMQRKRTRLLPQKEISRSAKQLDFSTAEKIRVVIKPWIRIDGVLNRRVLDRMLGAVFTYCLTHPGISLPKVQTRFVPALQPHHTRELVEMLVKLGCLRKRRLQRPTVTLFSKPAAVRPEESAEDWDVEENIFLEPVGGGCVKFGIFLSTNAYSSDFLS